MAMAEFLRAYVARKDCAGKGGRLTPREWHGRHRAACTSTMESDEGSQCAWLIDKKYKLATHLDVATLDLKGVSLQRPVVVHEGAEQRDCADLSVCCPALHVSWYP